MNTDRIDFELTPREKDQAVVYRLDIERQRRERNRKDAHIEQLRLARELQNAFDSDGPEAA